jgi:hypothetical protein
MARLQLPPTNMGKASATADCCAREDPPRLRFESGQYSTPENVNSVEYGSEIQVVQGCPNGIQSAICRYSRVGQGGLRSGLGQCCAVQQEVDLDV